MQPYNNDVSNDMCPLCKSIGSKFFEYKHHLFYKCNNCFSLFRDRSHFLGYDEEKDRYLEHNNDINDPRYRKFVNPIVSAVIRNHTKNDKGLDFGSGTGPVISQILKEQNYKIEQYDPFFCNRPELLDIHYNYIICCEVIEHFHYPADEFNLLKSLLDKDGKLYCMTDFYNTEIDFKRWYYKNDPTHVLIYSKETIEWIKEKFNFSDVQVEGRVSIFHA